MQTLAQQVDCAVRRGADEQPAPAGLFQNLQDYLHESDLK